MGLKTLLKLYGKIEAVDKNGNKVTHVWDYAKDEARLKHEMTKEEFKASEKAKWGKIKNQLNQ